MAIFVRNENNDTFVQYENNNKFFSDFAKQLNANGKKTKNVTIDYNYSTNQSFVVKNLPKKEFIEKCKDAFFVATLRRNADKLLKLIQKQINNWPWGLLIGERDLEYVQELEGALQVCQKMEKIGSEVLENHMNFLLGESKPKSHCALKLENTVGKFSQIKKVVAENALNSLSCPLQRCFSDTPKADSFVNQPLLLLSAIKNGEIKVANDLVNLGLNLDFVDENGDTPLTLLCKAPRGFGHCYSILALKLIEKNANIHAKNKKGETALLLACKNDLQNVAIALIEKDVNAKVVDKTRKSPLIYAWRQRQTQVILKLLEKGVDFRPVVTKGETLLLSAIKANMPQVASALIARGDNIHDTDRLKLSPVLYACVAGFSEVALQLIEKGADINIVDWTGKQLLLLAIENNLPKVALKLIEKGADIDIVDKSGTPLLILACAKKMSEVALTLISKGANLNCTDVRDNTPLLVAYSNKLHDVVFKLLEMGSDINKANNVGNTVLIYALKAKDESMAVKLLESGANVNQTDHFGDTPFMLAFKNSLTPVIKKLLELNAHIGKANKDGDIDFYHAYKLALNQPSLQPILKAFFLEFFAQSDEMKSRIQESELSEIIPYFIEKPYLLANEAKEDKINPLEVAFLFDEKELARALAPHLGREEYKKYLDKLAEKYPTAKDSIFKFNLSAHFKIDLRHLAAYKTKIIPPKPPGVQIRDLLSIFDSLNLFNPEAANYVDPRPFLIETPAPTQRSLRKALAKLIQRIETKEAYYGTPQPYSQALNVHYAKIEAAITHVIKKLHEIEDNEENRKLKAEVICILSETIGPCGARLFGDSMKLYEKVVNGKTSSDNFEDEISEDLAAQRSNLLTTELMNNENVHTYNTLMKLLGKDLGIPNAEAFADLYDPWEDDTINKREKTKRFFEVYTALSILQYLWPSFNGNNSGDYARKLDDWWKKNIPQSWEAKKYNIIKEKLQELKQKGLSDTEIAYRLQEVFQIDIERSNEELLPEEAIVLAKKLQWEPYALEVQLYYIKQAFAEFRKEQAPDKVIALFLESHGIQVGNNQSVAEAINTHCPKAAPNNEIRLTSIEGYLSKLKGLNVSDSLLKMFLSSHNIPVSKMKCPDEKAIEDMRKYAFTQSEVYNEEMTIRKAALVNMLEKRHVLAPAMNYEAPNDIDICKAIRQFFNMEVPEAPAEKHEPLFFFNA